MPLAAYRAARHASLAIDEAEETEAAARARVHGKAFTAAVDAIRRAVPADADYLLIDASPPAEGRALWVRYDLAPRRVILVREEPDRRRSARWLRQHVPGGIRWVVALDGDEPPALAERFQYFAAREQSERGR